MQEREKVVETVIEREREGKVVEIWKEKGEGEIVLDRWKKDQEGGYSGRKSDVGIERERGIQREV